MTRLAWPRLLACLVAAVAVGLGSLAVAPSARAAGDGSTRTPLQVSIETLAPATIPQHGRVRLSGRIVNTSGETWTGLQAYLLTSGSPIRTSGDLARAAATPPATEVGSRVAAPGLYERVGDLAPGESVGYQLSVPRQDLGISGEPGIYWVGVHVLGASKDGRDSVADGRARTFMPLLPRPGTPAAERARTRLALVVPLKEPVRRGASGQLLDARHWRTTLSADGRLDRLLRLSHGSRVPMTWAVDPAVLDAAQSVADGNPTLDPSPAGSGTTGTGGSSGPSASPSSPSAGSSSSPSASTGQQGSGATGEPTAAERAARVWLAEFRRQSANRSVAALPYGDLDVASALAQPRTPAERAVYRRAVRLGRSTMAAFGVASPADLVDPGTGYLPGAALRRVRAPATVVLTDSAFPGATGPVVTTRRGQAPVVLTDEAAGSGGPAPGSPYAALAMRQRILSESALHALSPQRTTPLVVSTPSYWNPGDSWSTSDFFAGLHQRWLQPVDLSSVVATSSPTPGNGTEPVYPAADRLARVPAANLRATNRLTGSGKVYGRLLAEKNTVADTVARAALLASASSARADPGAARDRALAAEGYVRAQMSGVRVEGLGFVMMSGEAGPIQVTLANDLERSVRAGLQVTTSGPDLRIKPVDPVTVGPGRRTTIRLAARSSDIGVHAVTLRVTDSAGVPVGSVTRFCVRTCNVSTVIWVIMAAGGALLLLAIVIRLIRRIRRRKSTHGPRLPRDSADRRGHQVGA